MLNARFLSRQGCWWVLGTVASVLLIAPSFGASLRPTLAYLSYLTGYELLPGACVYLLLVKRPRGLATVFLHGLLVGLLLEVWTYLLLIRLGATAQHWLYPAGVAALAVWKRRTLIERLPSAGPKVSWAEAAATVLVPASLVFVGALANFDVAIDQHFTWAAAFANAVGGATSWPPQEPFLFDVPLYYHYLFNAHVAAARTGAGVPVLVTAARLGVIVHLFVLIALMVNFSRARFRSGWVGLLAAAQILGTYGFTKIMWGVFHQATPLILMQLPSALIALAIFLVLVDEAADFVDAEQRSAGHFVLIAGGFVLSSGMRANLLPVFLCALGLLALVSWIRKRVFPTRVVALAVAAVVALVFGMVFFYGFLDPAGSSGSLAVAPLNRTVGWGCAGLGNEGYSPLYEWLFRATASERLASLLYLIAAVCGRLGLLLPGLIFYLATRQRPQGGHSVTLLLLGAFGAGVGVLGLLKNEFQEQWAFYWFGDLGLALLGAEGLRLLFSFSTRIARAPRAALISLAVGGAALQGYEWTVPLLRDLRSLGERSATVNYQRAPEVGELVRWGDQGIPRGSVLVTAGNANGFDHRIWPVVLPGVQLYADRYILRVYLNRRKPDPRLVSRSKLLDQPSTTELMRTVRREVPASRAVFLLWMGAGGPTPTPELVPVFASGTFQLFRYASP